MKHHHLSCREDRIGPRNPVETMAAQAGTIPYELTSAVSNRVPRVYLQNGQVTERELLLRF